MNLTRANRPERRINIFFVFVLGLCASGFSAPAADLSGFYEILSGSYSECCGIAGESHSTLPNASQRFIRLKIDSQANTATMTFLGQDLRTVFNTFSCALGTNINFSFEHGFVFTNALEFLVDPGPNGLYWHYTVTNSATNLQIDGMVGTAQGNCADAPTQFSHSGVLAVSVPSPKIQITEFSNDGASLIIQGTAGWTNVIEASSDLTTWAPISTNVMPNTVCPICPFIQVHDPASNNSTRRFYRSLQFP